MRGLASPIALPPFFPPVAAHPQRSLLDPRPPCSPPRTTSPSPFIWRHERYLNYALSVITARALPDVRDGLKPVQRRILYAMHHNLSLGPDKRYRKSAAVVGEVMASTIPTATAASTRRWCAWRSPSRCGIRWWMDRATSAAWTAMVRPRCGTPVPLRHIAVELLEIGQRTVDFGPTTMGRTRSPSSCRPASPSCWSTGRKASRSVWPPASLHSLREVIDAAVVLIDEPEADVARLCRKAGPRLPDWWRDPQQSGRTPEDLRDGQGTVSLRGPWTSEKVGR